MTLNFIASPAVWPTTADRYKETLKVVIVDTVEGAANKGKSRVRRGIRDNAETDTLTIRSQVGNFATALNALP